MPRRANLPLAVAVTGGIGSGKSTLCRILRRQPGVASVDADRIVRGLLARNPAVGRAVAELFGEGLLAPGGGVDRARLAERVFGDRRRLRQLEALLHPLVRARLARKVAALKRREGIDIVLVEIPLLVEAGRPPWCDRVVAVEATEAVRLDRLRRRGLRASLARRRMARQAGDEARRELADLVVRNDGDRHSLEEGARGLLARLLRTERR